VLAVVIAGIAGAVSQASGKHASQADRLRAIERARWRRSSTLTRPRRAPSSPTISS
jgi:hypothetical protein